MIFSLIAAVALSSPALASIGSSNDYGQIQDFLNHLETQFPNNAEVFELGVNTQGESIRGLKIGNGPVKNLIVATHHGNEYGSTEVALGAAAEFAMSPVAGRTIYVIPVLNISGFNATRREEALIGGGLVDPNRDYPGPCVRGNSYRLKSTKALADFIARENIVNSLTLHTSGGMVLYPWGISTTQTSTPYDQEFIDLSNMCAIGSNYQVGNSTELLYPADGAFEDYAFYTHGIWSILIEIGQTHYPSERELPELVRENMPGLRKFMAEAPATRATNHAFHGTCDARLMRFDLRNE